MKFHTIAKLQCQIIENLDDHLIDTKIIQSNVSVNSSNSTFHTFYQLLSTLPIVRLCLLAAKNSNQKLFSLNSSVQIEDSLFQKHTQKFPNMRLLEIGCNDILTSKQTMQRLINSWERSVSVSAKLNKL